MIQPITANDKIFHLYYLDKPVLSVEYNKVTRTLIFYRYVERYERYVIYREIGV